MSRNWSFKCDCNCIFLDIVERDHRDCWICKHHSKKSIEEKVGNYEGCPLNKW